jgi:uncharacterized surface protein with fasciclin (FAS1) repeats
MNIGRLKIQLISGLFIIGLLFPSCNETPELYTHPDWLGGTNIETLEKEGNCSIFLALMDKAEYRVPIEKQLFTLFVPRDDAFEDYFAEKGITSVNDLTHEEAFRLFTMFVFPNPLSRYQLIYEYAWDLESPEGEYGSLFFRKRTRSLLPSYTETPLYHPIYMGEKLTIETELPIWVPFFTTEYMKDFNASLDGSDYEFLCRGSQWSGTQWHDAMVTDAEVRTSNGFIYYLDRVVDQHPTADQHLLNNPGKYGVFYDMLQPFATYTRWVNRMNQVVYRKGYNTSKIYDIATPEGPTPGATNHTKRNLFSLFVPTNEAWNTYFDENNISDIMELPEITRIYLIQSHILNSLALRSRIDSGMRNTFGEDLELNTTTDITDSYLCNNAAFYEINKVLVPFVFRTVTGPVFLDNNYSTFLLALYLADRMNFVSSRDFDVTVFALSNEQFEQIGVRYVEDDNVMQFLTVEERWVDFTPLELQHFVDGYIAREKLTDFSGEGFFELASGEYVYYNDNQLYAAGNAEQMEPVAITGSVENEINGVLHYKSSPLRASGYTVAETMLNDPDMAEFYNLFVEAGLVTVSTDPRTFEVVTRINFLRNSNDFTIFAPSNEAILEARNNGLIPETLSGKRNFIYNHVITKNVIFDDGKISGDFNTRYAMQVTPTGTIWSKLKIDNSIHNLVITDMTGKVIEVPHDHANVLIRAGVIHKIPAYINLPQ